MDELLTTEELASYLAKTDRWILKWGPRYGLPRVKVGRSYGYRLSEIDEWLNTGRAGSEMPI